MAIDNNMLSKVWQKVFSLIKTITGDVDVESKGTLQSQIDEIPKSVYGFENKTTTEDEDGVVTETFNDGRKIVTSENEEGNIIQNYYNKDGVLKMTKTIKELEDGTTKEIVTNGGV